jgi:hypothetical protein
VVAAELTSESEVDRRGVVRKRPLMENEMVMASQVRAGMVTCSREHLISKEAQPAFFGPLAE